MADLEFKRATVDTAFLKVLFYGGPGSGKTYTALLCASKLGKVALVDTERGSDFYAKDFEFDIFHTRSIWDVVDLLEKAVEQKYDCLIIDQITHLWEGAQEEYLAGEREKMSKAWLTMEKSGNLPWTSWRHIKKPYKKLLSLLLSAPIHVFMIGRATTEYEQMPDGSPKKVGERVDAEKGTPYEPHILIKMERARTADKWLAWVEKDRSNTISGKVFTNPTHEMLSPVLAKLGRIQGGLPEAKEEVGEELTQVEQELIEAANLADASQIKLIKMLAQKGGVADEIVEEKVRKITRVEASLLINQMTLQKYEGLTK